MRPPFEPTDEQRRTVRTLSALGIRQKQIGLMVGLKSPKTLREHFREELDKGSVQATATVAQTLYEMATSGKNTAATIFWMKTRGGMRERAKCRKRTATGPLPVVVIEKGE